MLFPEPTSSTFGEPPVWFRRLVILDFVDPEPAIIREIPFELGLNVVCTRPPPDGSTEALGHDVGKTLLTRLLRYCLGEETYAEGRTRSAIRRAFPDSYVAAEVRVAGQDWSVLRHVGAPASNPSRALLGQPWRELLNAPAGGQSYQQFLVALTDATLQSIDSPLLTHAKRPVRWLDMLAWIARDQKCRYTHPLVWRHRDAESENDPLHVEDASTVLRCITGLMSAKEKELFEAHDQLLSRRQVLERESEQLRAGIQAEVGVIDEDLRQFLMAGDVPVNDLAPEILRSRANRLRDLRESERRSRNLGGLRDRLDVAMQARSDNSAEARQLTGRRTIVQEQLRQRQNQAPSPTIYDAFIALCKRPTDDCPAKLKIVTEALPDPYREEEIARLQAESREVNERLSLLEAEMPALEQAVVRARADLRTAEVELSTIVSGIDGEIAVHNALVRRVERHLGRLARQPQVAKSLTELSAEIQQSSEQQRQLRDSLAESREWLSSRFQAICHGLLGGNRRFDIVIEAKSIRLRVTGADGAPGEATSTSAQVLSLDLAALQAALDGFGHHPRLAILDSPREADMEIGIFQRLIALLAGWHQSERRRAFQVIITTTTRPNPDLLPEGSVRLELARTPGTELLFKREL